MDRPPDTDSPARAGWLKHIGNPVLTNVLLIALIAALGVDIAIRSSGVSQQEQDSRPKLQLPLPDSQFGKAGSRAEKGIINAPDTASDLPSRASKKKIHDRVSPSP